MLHEVSAAWEREELDKDLVRNGQTCVLQRLLDADAAPIEVTVRAHIVDYKLETIIAGSGLQAGDSHVILSTTQIDAAQWPGAVPAGQATPGDPRVPRKGDRLIVGGKARVVQAAWAAPHIQGELIRIEMTIR